MGIFWEFDIVNLQKKLLCMLELIEDSNIYNVWQCLTSRKNIKKDLSINYNY